MNTHNIMMEEGFNVVFKEINKLDRSLQNYFLLFIDIVIVCMHDGIPKFGTKRGWKGRGGRRCGRCRMRWRRRGKRRWRIMRRKGSGCYMLATLGFARQTTWGHIDSGKLREIPTKQQETRLINKFSKLGFLKTKYNKEERKIFYH